MSETANKYSAAARERAVRMVLDGARQHRTSWAAIVSMSSKISRAPQPLSEWVKKVEVDRGQRGGTATDQAKKISALHREALKLKTGQCDPPQGVRIVCLCGGRPPTKTMIQFMEDHGVEPFPVCCRLPRPRSMAI